MCVDPVATIDLGDVTALPELARAFNGLRGDRSYAVLARAAAALPIRDGRKPVLPSSTVSDLLSGKRAPSKDTVITLLTVCGLTTEEAQRPWLAAWERVSTTHLRGPAGAVRVRHARPRLLGVHAAIHVENAEGELPPYVPRDIDANLQTTVAGAAARGGFVLLLGGSSAGKTRTMFEAVNEVLPEWWLWHPTDADAVREFAAAPPPRTVVWLDELQRYLNQPGGLPAGTIRGLITAGLVLVASLWPGEYSKRTVHRNTGQSDPYASDRELLDLAQVIAVPEEFSPEEWHQAEARADDRRIRIALDTADENFTQVLAAGPELIRWWEQAPANMCYGKAVITAALDARRVGAVTPVSREFLVAAAPAYLTPAEQAVAHADWFDQALDYATTSLLGAASALTPVPAGMGQIAGYEVADYLYQHALCVRRSTHLPNAAWKALIENHNSDDTTWLAQCAENRGRYREAEALWRRAFDAGAKGAGKRLAALYAEQGRIDDLTKLADTGDETATHHLATIRINQGHVDDALVLLQRIASTANWLAADQLISLLTDEGRIDEALAAWRRYARPAHGYSAERLTKPLVKLGRVDDLAEFADAGCWAAARRLAILLAEQGRINELAQRADASCGPAAVQLAELITKQGRIDDALAVLRPHVSRGDTNAAIALADLLVSHNRIDELKELAKAGDIFISFRLSELLAENGRVDELAELAKGGTPIRLRALAKLLVKHDRVDELAELATAGSTIDYRELIEPLVEHGRIDDAMGWWRERADAGDDLNADRLATMLVPRLAEGGRIEEALAMLRPGADTEFHRRFETHGAPLAWLLAKDGRVAELTQRASAGSLSAQYQLVKLLIRDDRSDDAVALVWQFADNAKELAPLLAEHGHVNDAIAVLRRLADAHDHSATAQMITLMFDHGRSQELAAELAAGTPGAADAYKARSHVSIT